MSLFSSILHKVFGASAGASPGGTGGASTGGLATAAGMPGVDVTGVPSPPATVGLGPAPIAPPSLPEDDAMHTPPTGAPVDVEAVLAGLAARKGGGGNWRSSIVDLLKMLDLDSSLSARKQLADELGVHAGADGSAEQNVALSRAVWQQLAENGGQVPDSLKG
ncbi:MAG: DUF3597 domain-containing protein [Roseococcus sp.]|nr:DUF3597 domain-containing protein [Roseococcus sp.]